MKRENENENENEEYYVSLLVLFVENVENVESALELFGAAAGLERGDPRFVCILACDSSETGFLDGMLLSSGLKITGGAPKGGRKKSQPTK